MQTVPSEEVYQFGPFVLDPLSRVLWRDGTAVAMPGKAFDLAVTLVTNRQRVVDRTELLELVWRGVVVEENTLTRHISTLRKLLRDETKPHKYIRTVSGRGYQFIAPVTELPSRPSDLQFAASSPDIAETEPAAEPVEPLESAVETSVELASDAPLPHAWWRQALAVALLAALAITSVLLAFPHLRKARTPDGGEWQVRRVTYLSGLSGLQSSPAWSPDGRAIAFASDRDGTSHIWVQRIGESDATRLTKSPAADFTPDWSPDNKSIVFRSERDGGGLFVMPVAGGTPTRLANFGYRPRWSPDGAHILFSTSESADGLPPKFYAVTVGTGDVAAVRPDALTEPRATYVTWRPNGDVSFLATEANGAMRFCATPLARGPVRCAEIPEEIRRDMEERSLVLGRFAWAPSGRYLYFEGSILDARSLWRVAIDPQTLAWQRVPERLTTGTTDDGEMSVSPDGRHIVFAARSTQTQIWEFPFDAAGNRVIGSGRAVTTGAGRELDVDVSRDGTRLAYQAVRAGRREIWERDMTRGDERLLVADDWERTQPLWSPDATRLAYEKRRVDGNGIRSEASMAILNVADGSEELVGNGNPAMRMVPFDWSADGRSLVGRCLARTGGLSATCLIHLPTAVERAASVHVLAEDPDRHLFQPTFAPNQRWISFMAVDPDDSGTSVIYVMPASGGPWQAITDGRHYDDKPRWSADGRTIYFVSNRGGVLNLWGRRIDREDGTPVGEAFRVTEFETPGRMISTNRVRMRFTLTERTLFVPVETSTGELWMLEGLDP